MKIYKYIGDGSYIQGLPAQDVDADTLSPEQMEKLNEGVAAGIYQAPVIPAEKPSKKIEKQAEG